MRFLLDTNICIYIIKNSPASVINKFHTLDIGDIGDIGILMLRP